LGCDKSCGKITVRISIKEVVVPAQWIGGEWEFILNVEFVGKVRVCSCFDLLTIESPLINNGIVQVDVFGIWLVVGGIVCNNLKVNLVSRIILG
jgi:hypothetical protein